MLGLVLWLGACVTRPVYAPPWYDLDQSWLNDGLGGWAPGRPVDRAVVARAAYARERRWAVKEIQALKGRLAAERRVVRSSTAARRRLAQGRRPAHAAPDRGDARRRSARTDDRVARKRVKRKRRGRKTTAARRHKRARASTRRPAKKASRGRRRALKRATRPRPSDAGTRVATRPVLGDGTVPSELVAGAQRLLGLEAPLTQGSMLRHLLVVAAAPLGVRAPAGQFLAAAWEAARKAGRAREPKGYRPKPGDIALFDGASDVDDDGRPGDPMSLVAVVERVRPSGVIVCIGEVGGVIRRFRMDPRRPLVVRDERAGEIVNDALRPRSLSDGPAVPTLAGALLGGYISF